MKIENFEFRGESLHITLAAPSASEGLEMLLAIRELVAKPQEAVLRYSLPEMKITGTARFVVGEPHAQFVPGKPVEEPKPEEPKPVEDKPEEKPVEDKPEEKPVEETKPLEEKPVEEKPKRARVKRTATKVEEEHIEEVPLPAPPPVAPEPTTISRALDDCAEAVSPQIPAAELVIDPETLEPVEVPEAAPALDPVAAAQVFTVPDEAPPSFTACSTFRALLTWITTAHNLTHAGQVEEFKILAQKYCEKWRTASPTLTRIPSAEVPRRIAIAAQQILGA